MSSKLLLFFIIILLFFMIAVSFSLFTNAYDSKIAKPELAIKESKQTTVANTRKVDSKQALTFDETMKVFNENEKVIDPELQKGDPGEVIKKNATKKGTEFSEVIKKITSVFIDSDMAEADVDLSSMVRLNFLNIESSKLPSSIDILSRSEKDFRGGYGTQSINKRKDGHFYFSVNKENYYFLNIFVNGFGFANDVYIPKKSTKTIDIALSKGARFSVKVVDKTGEPISKVKIALGHENESKGFRRWSSFFSGHIRVVTDKKGLAEFIGLEPGHYEIDTSHPRFYEFIETVKIFESSDVVYAIKLELGLMMKGQVVGVDGKAVEGVSLFLKKKKISRYSFSYAQESISDKKGNFEYHGLKNLAYTLRAYKKGVGVLNSIVIEVDDSTSEKELIFKLEAPRNISGKVIDASNGKPVVNVEIKLGLFGKRNHVLRSYSRFKTVLTDSAGRFEFDFLDEVEYMFEISDEAYEIVDGNSLAVKPGEKDIVIKIKKKPVVTGKVLLPTGGLADGLDVYIIYEGKEFENNVEVTYEGDLFLLPFENYHDKKSFFRFKINKVGFKTAYSKLISFDSWIVTKVPVEITLTARDSFLFNVVGFKQLGIKRINMFAMPKVNKKSSGYDVGTVQDVLTLDKEGHLEVKTLMDDNYMVVFNAKNYSPIVLNIVNGVSYEKNLLFEKGGVISGIAYSSIGEPLKNKKVRLKNMSVPLVLMNQFEMTIYSDAFGGYQFSHLIPGSYGLSFVEDKNPNQIYHSGRKNKIEKIELPLNAHVVVDLKLSKTGQEVSGQVYLDDVVLETGAYISLISDPGYEYYFSSITLNEQHKGRFSFSDVPLGKFVLAVASGQGKENKSERYKIEVRANANNFFRIDMFKGKLAGVVKPFDGSTLHGQAYFFKAGTLNKNFNPLYFENNVYYRSVIFKNGFSMKVPENQKMDIYFLFRGRHLPSFYLKNYDMSQVRQALVEFQLPKIIERKIVVYDQEGLQVKNFDLMVFDKFGVPMVGYNKSKFSSIVKSKGTMYLSSGVDYTLYLSKLGEAVYVKKVVLDSPEPIVINFKPGFYINLNVIGSEDITVQLFDEKKNKIHRPLSNKEYVEFKNNLRTSSYSYNDGLKIKVIQGNYFLKIFHKRTGKETWSSMISIFDQDIAVSINLE